MLIVPLLLGLGTAVLATPRLAKTIVIFVCLCVYHYPCPCPFCGHLCPYPEMTVCHCPCFCRSSISHFAQTRDSKRNETKQRVGLDRRVSYFATSTYNASRMTAQHDLQDARICAVSTTGRGTRQIHCRTACHCRLLGIGLDAVAIPVLSGISQSKLEPNPTVSEEVPPRNAQGRYPGSLTLARYAEQHFSLWTTDTGRAMVRGIQWHLSGGLGIDT